MIVQEIGDKISGYFFTRPEIKVGYIFGSIARGETSKLSDIDIAILVDEGKIAKDISYAYKAKLITDLIHILKNDKIDLVILNGSPLLLQFNVIREGELVYCNDEVGRVQFEVKTMSLYFGEAYYYKRHAEATINRVAIEGLL